MGPASWWEGDFLIFKIAYLLSSSSPTSGNPISRYMSGSCLPRPGYQQRLQLHAEKTLIALLKPLEARLSSGLTVVDLETKPYSGRTWASIYKSMQVAALMFPSTGRKRNSFDAAISQDRQTVEWEQISIVM